MDTSSVPSDAERELAELRARAYGPDADIQTDPAALARLWELEATHLPRPPKPEDDELDVAGASPGGEPVVEPSATGGHAEGAGPRGDISPDIAASEIPPPSGWRGAASTRGGRATIVAAALATVLAVGYAVGWLVGAHPDATLRPTADEASNAALSMIHFLDAQPDATTIRGYESYRGIEPWFFENEQGYNCFMLVTPPAYVDGANCVPPGVDLFADMALFSESVAENSEPLPAGSIIRFHYLADRVDVHVYPASHTD